ncbi:MAG: mycoredoxin [Corynebacterium sp.]|nr:mycoredoxin [Corynebacterium sp.]
MTATNPIRIYATDWCPFCRRLRRDLDSNAIPYEIIDIEADEEAALWVESVNDGNRVVPTVRYSDGEVATNPPAAAVRQRYTELTANAAE